MNKKIKDIDIKTGDLLLCSNHKRGFISIFDWIIRIATNSDITHIGMILKNPTWIKPELTGIYVWESGIENCNDAEDNIKKIGVQITPIDKFIEAYTGNNSYIHVRKLLLKSNDNLYKETFSVDKMFNLHNKIYNKKYDINPVHWIEALIHYNPFPHMYDKFPKSFWCSALIGYILINLKILNNNVDWSIISPAEFTYNKKNKKILDNNLMDGFIYDIELPFI